MPAAQRQYTKAQNHTPGRRPPCNLSALQKQGASKNSPRGEKARVIVVPPIPHINPTYRYPLLRPEPQAPLVNQGGLLTSRRAHGNPNVLTKNTAISARVTALLGQ